MKKMLALLSALLLVLAFSTATLAGKPVDADGDGYTSNQDCKDDDNTVYPGAPELCDGKDNNCDGVIDEGCGGGGTDPNHGSLTWADYPSACLNCHATQAGNMFGSTHYQWLGDTTEMVNQNGTQQGKLTNAINSYCINILGDWKICGKCHAGRGKMPNDATAGQENIDCLMCHNKDYADVRTRLADGSMGPPDGTPQATLDGFVQSVAPPARENCLKCHAYAGGGDAVKRGDLSWATASNADAGFDVHMNALGPNLACQSCHVFQNHRVIGRGSDLRPTDDLARGSEVKCSTATCHPNMDGSNGHTLAGANRTDADRHVARVACQSCHIDVYAKVATETHRDWRLNHEGLPADGTHGPGHPYSVKLPNLVPTFKFWNRLSDNYLLGDTAVVDPATGKHPTSRPQGNINDGKLYPFKYKTADQPKTVADNKLIALDTLVYIGQTGDVAQAIQQGLQNMGYTGGEAYEWVTTDTYQLLNHGVAPATSVDCAKCHNSWGVDTDSELDKLGYKLKGPKSQVCSQCHAEKNLPRDHVRMHGHLNKGSGIDCYYCHDFTRPERGLCDPCDPACNAEFVDTNPYPHVCPPPQ